MSSKDIAYYSQRAEIERDRALDAPTPEIGAIHEKLATRYEELVAMMKDQQGVDGQSSEPALHIVQPGPQDKLQ